MCPHRQTILWNLSRKASQANLIARELGGSGSFRRTDGKYLASFFDDTKKAGKADERGKIYRKRRYAGRNPVFSLLEESPDRCMKVIVSKTVQPHIKARLQDLCRAANIVLKTAEPAALDKMTGKENHQGVVAYMAPMKLWEAEELIQMLPKAPEPAMVILCDHLQDPHNLGAVIRSAEAAGASAVLIPKRGGVLPRGQS